MFCFSKMHFLLLLLSNFQLYIPPQESQVEYQNQPWKHRKHEKKHFVKYKKSNCNNNTNNTYRQRHFGDIFTADNFDELKGLCPISEQVDVASNTTCSALIMSLFRKKINFTKKSLGQISFLAISKMTKNQFLN